MNFGEWDDFVRQVAAHDYARLAIVAGWPLREVLLAYLAHERTQAMQQYLHAQLLYQIRNSYSRQKQDRPPVLPKILREP